LVGLLGRGISPPQGLYLDTKIQYRKAQTHTSMPRAGFEPTILVFEWWKTVGAIDRAALGWTWST